MSQEVESGYKPIREQYGGFRPHVYIALFELDPWSPRPTAPIISEDLKKIIEESKNMDAWLSKKSYIKNKKSNVKKHL